MWLLSPLGIRAHEARLVGWLDWLGSLAHAMARESFDMVMMLIWSIWQERNDRV